MLPKILSYSLNLPSESEMIFAIWTLAFYVLDEYISALSHLFELCSCNVFPYDNITLSHIQCKQKIQITL